MGESPSPRSSNTALWAIVGLLAAILVVGAGGVAVMMSNQRAAERQKAEDAERRAADEKQKKNDEIAAGELKRIKAALERLEASRKRLIELGRKPDSPDIREIDEFLSEQRAIQAKLLVERPGWSEDGPPR